MIARNDLFIRCQDILSYHDMKVPFGREKRSRQYGVAYIHVISYRFWFKDAVVNPSSSLQRLQFACCETTVSRKAQDPIHRRISMKQLEYSNSPTVLKKLSAFTALTGWAFVLETIASVIIWFPCIMRTMKKTHNDADRKESCVSLLRQRRT